MMWYAIVEKETGRLHSVGVGPVADPLAKEFEALELGEDFKYFGQIWDEQTRTFGEEVANPIVEHILQRMIDAPELDQLTAEKKSAYMTRLRQILLIRD